MDYRRQSAVLLHHAISVHWRDWSLNHNLQTQYPIKYMA